MNNLQLLLTLAVFIGIGIIMTTVSFPVSAFWLRAEPYVAMAVPYVLLSRRPRTKATTFTVIIIILLMMVSCTQQCNPGTNAGPASQVALNNPESLETSVPQRGDQTVIEPTTTTTESSMRKKARTTVYYMKDVGRITGWVRSSMPEANDTELIIMLCLWIWGFSVLNLICILILCCCR